MIAAGGMATVHYGRLLGPVGFSRTVAIKRLHSVYATDPEFVSMFLDEARLASRIRHPNVVPTLDVVAAEGELFVVMDYIQGESLASVLRGLRAREERIPPRIGVAIISGALQGLHAAHEAKDERGVPLGIVHRDVSPQNVIVGADGLTRVLDFGVAKAAVRLGTTRDGQIKGKLSYMAPEQMQSVAVTRKADIYSTAVLLWEVLTGQKLFCGDTEAIVLARILGGEVQPPSEVVRGLPKALDAVVLKGLARDPGARFETARDMALALERTLSAASGAEVAQWLEQVAGQSLAHRANVVADIEADTGSHDANLKDAIAQISKSQADSDDLLPRAQTEFKPVPREQLPSEPTPPPREEHHSNLSQVSVFTTGGAKPPRKSSPVRLMAAVAVGTALVVSVSYLTYERLTAPSDKASAKSVPTATAPPAASTAIPAETAAARGTTSATAPVAATSASTSTTTSASTSTTTSASTSTTTSASASRSTSTTKSTSTGTGGAVRFVAPRREPTATGTSKNSAFSGLGGRD